MKRILISGFEPFHNASENPSQAIVEAVSLEAIEGVHTVVLPVEFGRSSQVLIDRINEVSPDVVIMLGQAEGRTSITPEKIAINFSDARIPDNAGNQPKQSVIIEGGHDGLFSTLKVEQIIELLSEEGIPSSISLSAGTFVCNNLFYLIQNYCRDRNIASGFIHVPLMSSQENEFPGLPTMQLETMIKATKIIVNTHR